MSASSPKALAEASVTAGKQAAVKTQKVARDSVAAAASAAKKAKDAVPGDVGQQAVAAVSEIKTDILSGQDGLGSIVKQVAKKNRTLDRVLHVFNDVGCECADKNRIKILLFQILVGACCFTCALLGSFGLGSFALKELPWAYYNNVEVDTAMLTWWYCGPAGETESDLVECFDQMKNSTCYWPESCYDTAPAFYYGIKPVCDAYAASDAVTSVPWMAAEAAANPCALFFSTNNQSNWNGPAIVNVDFHLNQWGFCMFPRHDKEEKADLDELGEDGSPSNTWIGAMFKSNKKVWDGLTVTSSGGLCREWGDFDGDWADKHVMECAEPAVDAFSLIAGAFGGFMKMIEPISRMKRSTDNHQKTIVMFIIMFSSIPAILGVITFRTGCVSALSTSLDDDFGKPAKLGAGCICFILSLVLYVPIWLTHLIIPAGSKSAWDTPATEPTIVKETEMDGI